MDLVLLLCLTKSAKKTASRAKDQRLKTKDLNNTNNEPLASKIGTL
jgi:hypothetical protein